MTTLRKLLTAGGFTTGLILAMAFDALPWRWLMLLIAVFLGELAAVWLLTMANKDHDDRTYRE